MVVGDSKFGGFGCLFFCGGRCVEGVLFVIRGLSFYGEIFLG